jgi:hypothetical protein
MSNPLSPTDLELYRDILQCLNSVAYCATDTFHRNPVRRGDVLLKVRDYAHQMKLAFGCGDLCPDKEKGCVPCNSD